MRRQDYQALPCVLGKVVTVFFLTFWLTIKINKNQKRIQIDLQKCLTLKSDLFCTSYQSKLKKTKEKNLSTELGWLAKKKKI